MTSESVIDLIVDEATSGEADVKVTDLLKLITDLAIQGQNQAKLIHQLASVVRFNTETQAKQMEINAQLETRIRQLEAKTREHEHLH
jgi:hypothetical protein